MSTILFARRSLLLIAGLLVCGLTLGAPARAGNLEPILQYYWFFPNLEHGNGNKAAVGRFNHLHYTFANEDPDNDYSDIWYVHHDPTPTNPYPMTEKQISFDGTSYQPALALDTGSLANNGLAAIVWVSKPSPESPFGAIYYSYQTQLNCASWGCWSQPQQIVFQGAEPSIVAANGTVHLTWTSGDRVQYTSFPRTSPPSTPLWLGEVVEFTNCPNTRFHKPSIALAHPPCGTQSIKIAALLASNEQSSAGTCQSANTQAGPRVYERNATTQTWSMVYNDVVSDSTPYQPDPVAVSLSLSANRTTGDFYLAWSDEQDSSARTRVGHGNGANWDVPQTISNLRRHVHLAAKGGGAAGHFRLAVSEVDWGTGAYHQTGKWSGGGLSWTSPAATIIDWPDYPLAGNPQALYWRRCTSGQLSEIKVYTEASEGLSAVSSEVANDFTQTGPVNCFQLVVGDAVVLNNCFQTHARISIGQMVLAGGTGAVVVELGETGVVSKVSGTGAEIVTLNGGTIQATWAQGDVVASWENGFIVATQRDTVRFSSKNAELRLEELGTVADYTKK